MPIVPVVAIASIEVREHLGPEPDHEHVCEEVTGEMKDALLDLSEERTVPLVG